MLRVVVIGPDKPIYHEADAAKPITPGQIVKLNADAEAIKNTVASNPNVAISVAVENDLFGKGIDDPYAVGERVIYQTLRSGCEFMGLVPAGTAAIDFDDPLTLDDAGNLIPGTDANSPLRARTAVDNSGGATPARVRAFVN